MRPVRFAARHRALALALTAAVLSACDSSSNADTIIESPNLPPVVIITAPSLAGIEPGQTLALSAAAYTFGGAPSTEAVTWSSASPSVATVSAAGVVTGVSAGATLITAKTATAAATLTIAVKASPVIRINEVESNLGTPGDWVELFNPTNAAVDISGWGFRDNDPTHAIYRIPTGTSIPAGGYYVLEEAAFGFGLGAADDARLYNAFSAEVDTYSWTAHASTTYGRCPNGSGGFTTMNTVTKGAANDCRATIRINEVESSGGVPGDWIELINVGPAAVDLSNFLVKDDDDTRTTRLPAGTMLAPGGLYVIEEAVMGFGLGSADAARLYDSNGILLDSYSWTSHAATTYGRCPDGSGGFTTTGAVTKGTLNDCTSVGGGPVATTWPGGNTITVADNVGTFGGNLSGLTFEGASGIVPTVLWGARNGPGALFRLIQSGAAWIPDATTGWGAGKLLRYPDGTGDVDAEGVAYAGSSANGVYIAAERNNSANSVSRNSILRYDVSGAAATLTATNEWNLTADIPATGANTGFEAITWIPDSVLVARGFVDEAKGRAYAPADYANHGTGVFFVGVEQTGLVYAYALNHTNNTFTRLATIATPWSGVMDLEFDQITKVLWAVCDDGCGGQLATFEIDRTAGAATLGRFLRTRLYARPAGMPNLNNEGFAIGTATECVGNVRPAIWADDSETGGNALRTTTISCGGLPAMLTGRPPSTAWRRALRH